MSEPGLVGRTFGGFVLRDKIGEGGFGAVYRAEQVALGREAVIKVLHHRHRASDHAVERFLREARLASQLDHPYAAHGVIVASDREDAVQCEVWLSTMSIDGKPVHPDEAELRRIGRARDELGAGRVRPPRWGNYLGPDVVAAAGGRARFVETGAVVAEVGPLLYVQLSASPRDAAEPRRRALAELLGALVV